MAKAGFNLSWQKSLGRLEHNDSRLRHRGGDGGDQHAHSAIVEKSLPRAPGFTIAVQERALSYSDDPQICPELQRQVAQGVAQIGAVVGKTFGDPADPLFLSVKFSGSISTLSMMEMEIVIEVGLNDATVSGLARLLGSERLAWDRYRRFIQNYAVSVLKIDCNLFEDHLEMARDENLFTTADQMQAIHWRTLVAEYKAIIDQERGRPFPQDLEEQLWSAIGLACASVRKDIPPYPDNSSSNGTTIISLQAVVFGNPDGKFGK